METKEKKAWTKALQLTIAKYIVLRDNLEEAPEIAHAIHDNWAITPCPLCELSKKPNNRTQVCKNCIHLTSYSQNKPCVSQKSFIPLQVKMDKSYIPTKREINYRIHCNPLASLRIF